MNYEMLSQPPCRKYLNIHCGIINKWKQEFLACMGGFSGWSVFKVFTRPYEQSCGFCFDVWWCFDSRYKNCTVTSVCSEQQDAMCFYHVQLFHGYCFVKQQMMWHALWKQILCVSSQWQYAKKRIRIYNTVAWNCWGLHY